MNTFRSFEPDEVDWKILAELQDDARLSYNAISRRVHLSAPAVAERVRRMEEAGVIRGYSARVDPEKAGHPLSAFIQLRCALGSCLLKTTRADDLPEVVEVHKLSGEFCAMLKVRTASLAHFEGLVEELGSHGELRTHLVLSTQFDGRPLLPPGEARAVSGSRGWSTPD